MTTLPDENAIIGADLPDYEFVKTREAIILLLPKLFRSGSCKFSDVDVLVRLVDETVEEIGHIWTEHL